MITDTASFLGVGWAFPPRFDPVSQGVSLVSGKEDINQSLSILLATSLRERVMQPQYGCNLDDFVFEGLNASIIGSIRDRVERAILFYEPRIEVTSLEVTPADDPESTTGRLLIAVEYVVLGTNSRFNFVYDYYLREADPIAQR